MNYSKLNRSFLAMTVAGILVFSVEARAVAIYAVNLTIGSGGVVGTITTNGNVGVIGASDIIGWNLNLTGGLGATLNLNNLDGLSGVAVGNNTAPINPNLGTPDLTADANNIYFDFSATDGGYLGFQVLPFYTGQKYFGAGALNNLDVFSGGLTAVPVISGDPMTIVESRTGKQIIASVVNTAVPDMTNSLSLLGLGLFGLAVFRRIVRG